MNELEYYLREFEYLRRAGSEFAQAHPDLANRLGLDANFEKDPFVERLIEAFAFLAGKIHERLDDDLPEFAEVLLEQLFPFLLRPFPSCSVLKVEPMVGAITSSTLVQKGSEARIPLNPTKVQTRVMSDIHDTSRSVLKEEAGEFIFRTVHDLSVHPLEIDQIIPDAKSCSWLIRFQPNKNVLLKSINFKQFIIYLSGNPGYRSNWLMYLTQFAQSLSIRPLLTKDAEFQNIDSFDISIVNLSTSAGNTDGADTDDASVIPYNRHAFAGYRLLHEYFSFPERFFFVKIEGLERFKAPQENCPFEIRICFNRPLPESNPGTGDILINCAPIVNLFDRMTEPIRVNQRETEYRVIPDMYHRRSKEIFSINRIVGVGEDKSTTEYQPLAAYDSTARRGENRNRYFYATSKRDETSIARTYIRLLGSSLKSGLHTDENFRQEVLSISATMSNGYLAGKAEEITKNTITEPINFPKGLQVRNITETTKALYGPDRQDYLWLLISHLGLNFRTLAETHTLKRILSLYNWVRSEKNANDNRIQSIVQVDPPEPRNLYRRGALIRAVEIKIYIDPISFGKIMGDLYLFAQVLSKFFTEYATINSAVVVVFKNNLDGKELFQCEPSTGKILPV